MKPKSALRNFIALVGGTMLAISSAHAITYTWTQAATGPQTWGTTTNWSGGNTFVDGSGNELAFSFTGVAGNATTITGVPSTLSMNVLTLAGTGPNSTLGSSITVGDNTSTWTIGDGTTSTVNLNSTLGGGSSDRDVRYTIAANLALSGGTSGITTFTGNSTSITGAVFSGNITETASGKGITKSGSSLLIFSGNNSYTGTTLVSAGTLRLNSATALSGGLGATGGTSALTINGTGVVELGYGNFLRNLGTGSSQFQITGGTSGFSAIGGPRVITVNNDASQELQWGSTSFAPTTLVLNAATANNSLELANKIDLNAATRTVQVNADKALLSGVIRTASGTAGLTKTGNGTLVLTGINTYNGSTTITAGSLSVGATDNLGVSGAGLIFNGGTLQVTGTTLTSISGIGHTVTFNANAKGFDIHNAANTFTVDQVLSGTTFTKSGAGTLVLNQNNTFTGATTATGGGTLVLDYTTNTGSKLADAAALTLNGSNLVLKGGTSLTETVGSTTLTANSGNAISRDGGDTKIILGTLTTNGLSNLTISATGIATTTASTTVASGILTLGRVTVGSDFAALDGSNNIVAYSGYTAATTAGGGNLTTVNQLTGGGTMAADLQSYSLRIANSGSSDILNLNSGVDLQVSNGGTIFYAGGSDNNYTINGSLGNSYLGSASGNQAFNVNVFTGTLTVNAKLTSSGSSSLAKAGVGTLVAGGTNTYTGATYVQQGVLRATNAAALGDVAGGTIVQGGAALELSSGITVGAEALSITGTGISNGGALRNYSGSNTYGGLITIGASGARINSDVVSANALTLTGGVATTLTQDVTFGGAGNTTVSTTAISGSGNLIKDGAGTLTLSATNTYTGATTVSNGTLLVNGSISTSILTTVASGATIGGSGTTGALTVSSGGFINPGNSPGILSTGNYTQAGLFTAEIGGLTAGTLYDQINVTGTVNITGGSLTASFTGGSYTANDLIFILLNDGSDAITGTYASYTNGATVATSGGFDWQISYFADSTGSTSTGGNDIALMAVAVPEPNAALLGGLGLLLLLRRRRP